MSLPSAGKRTGRVSAIQGPRPKGFGFDAQKKAGLPKQPSFNSVMVCLTYRPMPTTWPWLIVYALPPMLTVGT